MMLLEQADIAIAVGRWLVSIFSAQSNQTGFGSDSLGLMGHLTTDYSEEDLILM